ncbi:conserved membrane hypothetical protein [Hyella patelloides LEGE 07179]|uniref:DUF2157 domain-containing protein n=1 Tax=Hyella patelloides LEGE 07179 TaxID=945734 RepID=A0A563VKS5_9CYAN|nr:hypothetical protein [Hyella patelloides]VEP11933.1 conserved membrane hypothetical protein [Hyella patelloides LEGE 07179]
MPPNDKRQKQYQDNPWLNLEIYVKNDRPELLQGLDQWIQLNLISEAQVKNICRQHLSCTLPAKQVVEAIAAIPENRQSISNENSEKVTTKPNVVTQLWQSFLDELSIRWLLFLGIFLVVVSSGVLAASQWNNFPRFGQYLILLIYSFSFWGIGFWSSQQDNLKLTSQTLKAIAVLLVPINFWAINKLGLGNNILEWLTIIVAFITLTGTTYLQFKPQRRNQYFLPFFLLFSYLHLAWQIDVIPIIAIYSGIISISLIHYFGLLSQQQYPTNKLLFLFTAWLLLLLRELLGNEILIPNYLLAIALFSWLLATIYLTIERKAKTLEPEENKQQAEQITPLTSSALEGNKSLTNAFLSKIFQIISIIILTGTWLGSLLAGLSQALFFWQTVGISALAIHLFSQRLTLYWRKRDLTAIFLIGLQTLYISKELIPLSLRSNALDLGIRISQTEYFPESVFGVTLFPYVILFVWIATWLYRHQKTSLASFAEGLTLILGIVLTYLSFSNPTWRSLNLLLSTITLGYVAWIRQPLRISLIYLTHLLGLVSLTNAISVIFPNLSQGVWGSILTLLMAAELGIYISFVKQPRIKSNFHYLFLLKQSCWYFGLLLGAISYSCFFSQIETNPTPGAFFWGLIWLINPGMLTLVAKYTRKIQQRRLATILSCTALISAQFLVIGQPITRFISLALAIALMLVNAFNLRHTIVTVIHVGFGVSLIASVLYSYATDWNWLVVGAVTILGLYQFRQYLQQTLDTPRFSYISQRIGHGILGVGTEPINGKLIRKYIKAADYWAIFLILLEILLLTILSLSISAFQIQTQYLLTIILVATAIVRRYRKQPNNLILYALVWLIELFVAGLIITTGGNYLTLAVANIILGLISLFLVGWLETTSSSWVSLNLMYIPLVYGILGIFPRLTYFNAYTGLLTFGAAIILINVNFDEPRTNLITKYFAFAGISIGIYELVIYQMQLSSGGSAADGLTILALVAAAIAFSYRLGAWWYRRRQQTAIFALNLSQVIMIAHIHWAISSILKILAAGIAIESATPRLISISIATSFCLGAYALIQGKDREPETTTTNTANDWWVYVGLVEIAATLVYSRLIISKLSLFDPLRVIFTCVVALAIYQIPWQNFGWRATPWRRTALIIPALMAVVTAEDISYLSLLATTIFYLRIAYHQKNLRWSYVSLGFINWGIVRLVWQYNTESIWLAGIISLSILYIAQFDPDFKTHRQQRHYIRLMGCIVLCVTALFYQDTGVIPSLISLGLIFSGLGLRIRAFLFTGTITLILTVIYQLIILVFTYSFLKWIVGLLAGVCLIVVAAGFEKQRKNLSNRLQNYSNKLHDWQ